MIESLFSKVRLSIVLLFCEIRWNICLKEENLTRFFFQWMLWRILHRRRKSGERIEFKTKSVENKSFPLNVLYTLLSLIDNQNSLKWRRMWKTFWCDKKPHFNIATVRGLSLSLSLCHNMHTHTHTHIHSHNHRTPHFNALLLLSISECCRWWKLKVFYCLQIEILCEWNESD